MMTRRSFIAAAAWAGAQVSPASTPAPPQPPAEQPAGSMLYNIHTREGLSVVYRNGAGRYDHGAFDRLNHVLRCHYTGEVGAIDLRVIEFLSAVDQGLGGDREIHVISGFRSAEYNAWLIRRGSGVAESSLHLVGRAIDVRFPGLALGQVRRVALELGWGGVGYYPASGFVHLDSGRVRSW